MTADLRDGEVTLEQLLELHGDALLEELAAGLIGRVESYDAATQTCDVQPVVRRSLLCTDGTRRHDPMPILRNVRVAWSRGRTWFLHFPLAAGDFVQLSILDRDHAMWGQTGEISNPIDTTRLHHVSHAIARPGVFPRGQEISLTNVPDDALVLGLDGGATIRIKDDGTIQIGTNATEKAVHGDAYTEAVNDLLDGLDTWVTSVSTVLAAHSPSISITTANTALLTTIGSVRTQLTAALSEKVTVE